MGTVCDLLLWYGNGEALFGSLVRSIDADLRAGASSPLCSIMTSCGSDKGSGHHNYTYLYYNLFKFFRFNPKNVFELGIGSVNPEVPSNMGANGVPGASLRGWREFFPQASICGADIDRSCLFQESGIQTLYVDQMDPRSVSSLWEHVTDEFDLIVDDGLHEFEANRIFLAASSRMITKNGFYIIEDIIMDLNHISRYDSMLNAAGMSGFLYRLPHTANRYDNSVAVLCGPEFALPT